jgi:hypothetical protein
MVPSVGKEKIPIVTPPGIDPETVRLVAQCLNHYAIPGGEGKGNDGNVAKLYWTVVTIRTNECSHLRV